MSDAELRLRAVNDALQLGTWEWNVQTGEATFNSCWAQLLGFRQADLSPMAIASWTSRIHPDDREISQRALESHFSGGTRYYLCEFRMRHRDGHWLWTQARGRVITHTSDGRPEWMVGGHLDISELKTTQAHTQKLLEDKDVLLREVHHHIQSDMKNMVGLFQVKASTLTNPEAVSALRAASNRVRTQMALYDKLYRSPGADEDQITMDQFLSDIIDEVLAQFEECPNPVVEKDLAAIDFDSDQAQHVAIIVNELLTNIMKYAFEGRCDRHILVSLRGVGGQGELVVEDNGKGFPTWSLKSSGTGLGMALIRTIAEQLDGEVHFDSHDGARVTVRFPLHRPIKS